MRKNKKMEEMEKALRNAVKKSIFLCMSGLTGYLEKKIGRLLVHVIDNKEQGNYAAG